MANDKFERRFEAVEGAARNIGKSLHQLTLEELEALWTAQKLREG
jgi:uncharacterized protein YabN with tetrapyrrole methylase and pyrophosphatase domain